MTISTDVSAQPMTPMSTGQSWCAGLVRTGAKKAAAPSWLAPHGFDEDDSALPSEPPLLAIDADEELRDPVRISAVDEPRPSLISILPPATPIISLAPEVPQYPDLRDENAELRRALAALTGELSRVRKETREASEAELVKLACAIAERIVGDELSTDPGHIIAWAREGIEALDAKENVVVALAPDLARAMPNESWSELGANVAVEVDASLPESSCEVRSRTGVAKVSASSRMTQMKSELGAGEEAP